jgi:hypothetical protein
MEDLEWARYQTSSDTNKLDEFINRYPNGQHIVEARRLADQLAMEDREWNVAVARNTLETWQSFLDKYPHSRHVPDCYTMMTQLKDGRDILQVIHAFQDSYNRRDSKALLELWPSFPATVVQSLFKEKRSGTINLLAQGSPVVKGDVASMLVAIKRQTEAGGSEKTVGFQFKKQNDHWVITTGSL